MEAQIKTAVKAGNSSAVILPRAWLNKEVRIELVKKTPEMILCDVLTTLKKHISLESIIGIYLVGSYARGEEEEGSDMDILVVTDNIDREMIENGIYNIFVISWQLLHQKLSKDLFPIGQMIREARPLLNSGYIKDLKIKVTRKNVKWYLDTTGEKLKIIKNYLNGIKTENKKYLSDKVAYTLVLRIRTLEIIKKLIENKVYSKKEFVKLIENISDGKGAYGGYLNIKNNLGDKTKITLEEAGKLYEYLKKDLTKVLGMLK